MRLLKLKFQQKLFVTDKALSAELPARCSTRCAMSNRKQETNIVLLSNDTKCTKRQKIPKFHF